MTCPVKAIFLLQKDYYIGFVGLMHIQFCQPTGQEACLLGTIHLSFFLLPLAQGESLGVPVYKDRGLIKKRRSLQIGNWKDDKWPPECIILYYVPANWAEDGSWGYQTPIYMHNRIIWLQAAVEIFTNEMVKFHNLLAEQQTKIHNVIYQNHLV